MIRGQHLVGTTLILVVLCVSQLAAQSNLNPVGVALGGCSIAVSSGADALFCNPALIHRADQASLQIIIAPAGILVGSSAMPISSINKYFGNHSNADGTTQSTQLSDADRDILGSDLSGATISADLNVATIAVCWQPNDMLSIGLCQYTSYQFLSNTPDEFGKLFTQSLGDVSMNLGAARMSLLAYSSMQLSAALELLSPDKNQGGRSLTIGASAKRLQGIGYGNVSDGSHANINPFVPAGWDSTKNVAMDLVLATESSGVTRSLLSRSNFLPGMSSVNIGYGADIGLSYAWSENNRSMRLSLSVTDIGFIRWTQLDTYSLDINDTVSSALSMDQGYLDRHATTGVQTNAVRWLPTRVHLGASMQIENVWQSTEAILLAAECTEGLNKEGNNTAVPRIGIGCELAQNGVRPAFRCGLHAGGVDPFGVSAGLGWRIADCIIVDGSIGSLNEILVPAKARWLNASCRLRIDI